MKREIDNDEEYNRSVMERLYLGALITVTLIIVAVAVWLLDTVGYNPFVILYQHKFFCLMYFFALCAVGFIVWAIATGIKNRNKK